MALLKKEEQGNEVKSLYESSNILSSTYDKATKDLYIVFKKNNIKYKYPNVKETDYFRFETAESQGKVFNSHIKDYEFENLGAVDTAQTLADLSEAKAQNKANYEKYIVDVMKSFITRYETNGNAFTTDYQKYFDDINTNLTNYNDLV